MTRRYAIQHVRTLLFMGFGAAAVALAMHAWLPGSRAADRQETAASSNLPEPVLDTHHLMELFNGPYLMHLKEQIRQQPMQDEEWTSLEESGMKGAELMNLTAIRKMAEEHPAAWKKHTLESRQAALKLAEVAKARDWPQTQAAYRHVVQSCNSCHQDIAPDHAPQLKP